MKIDLNKNKNLKKNKIDLFITSGLRDVSAVNRAVEIQDRLSEKSGSWSGENEIRKWRDIL